MISRPTCEPMLRAADLTIACIGESRRPLPPNRPPSMPPSELSLGAGAAPADAGADAGAAGLAVAAVRPRSFSWAD